MLLWFLFALLSALGFSTYNALNKYATRFWPRPVILLVTFFIASAVLFIIAFLRGLPTIGEGFLIGVAGTAIFNIIAWPILLRAYQIGELSSVFPMLLLTPIFMLGTSFIILGELPTTSGVIGMVITLVGLWIVSWYGVGKEGGRGILLGLLVAFLFSFSANFDKLVVLNSDAFLGPAVAVGVMGLALVPFAISSFRKAIISSHLPPLRSVWILGLLGLNLSFDLAVGFTALSLGLASYTILVKRMSIVFGVLWGWLFFKEKNIGAKLTGVVIAIVGLAVLLLAG